MAIDVSAGSATAVAYGSASDADAYFTARGITAWTGTEAIKEAALVRGCDYLERAYRGKWAGLRTNSTQALSWPRSGIVDVDGLAVDNDTIPTAIARANFEAALLVIGGTDLEPVIDPAGGVKREMVKAGPVETETEYGAQAGMRARITAIEGLLVDFLSETIGDGSVPLLRV